MTRIMGDATHDNVAKLPRSIQLAGLYNTGTPDIKATQADIDSFTSRGIPVVLIDQAFDDSPSAEAHAYIFDVEAGAFNPTDAGGIILNCTQPRPTIYVNRSNMYATIESALRAPNWKGDIWLAFPGWAPGTPLPYLPSNCRYVAIQDVYAGAYDLSTVLDDSWPAIAPAPAPAPNWTEEIVNQLPLVEIGQSGPSVRRVQGLCVAAGQSMAPWGIDGKFGNATKTAVENIQRSAGIQVDGIVYRQTWPVLLGV